MVALGRRLFRFFFPDQPIQSLDASAKDPLFLTNFLIEEGEQAQPQLP
jgi:hypothetical protein